MDKAERSLMVFGVYLIVIVGFSFMLLPTMALDMFGLRYGDDTWIRFVGLLASIIGAYYIVAAKEKLHQLFIWTSWFRYYAAAFMVIMFMLGKVGAPILLFAAIDVG